MQNHDQTPGEAESRKTPGESQQGSPASFEGSSKDGAGKPPVRNMADIARMFLDGARPVRTPPKRVAPANDVPVVKPVEPEEPPAYVSSPFDDSPIEMGIPVEAAEEKKSGQLPAFQLALAPRDQHHYELLASAANALAAENGVPVGLVAVHGGDVVMDVFNTDAEVPPAAVAAGALDVRLARTLFFMRKQAQHWIIAIPAGRKKHGDESSVVDALSMLQENVHDLLVISGVDKESIISAYQMLKTVCTPASLVPKQIRAFMVADDLAEAAAVHNRMRSAAQNFLRSDLTLAGVAPLIEDAEPLVMIPVGNQEGALWDAVLDLVTESRQSDAGASHSIDLDAAMINLGTAMEDVLNSSADAAAISAATFDHLTSVLDPDERAALNTGFDIREMVHAEAEDDYKVRDSDLKDGGVAVAPAVNDAVGAAAVGDSVGLLRAIEPATAALDLQAQWDVVARSARDFMEMPTALEAGSPLEGRTLLALDGKGVLHVWMMGTDSTTWPAVWQWAREHRHLLAMTRREAKFDPLASVRLHLVLPMDCARSSRMMHPPLPEMQVYRIHGLALGSRRALVLVPVG